MSWVDREKKTKPKEKVLKLISKTTKLPEWLEFEVWKAITLDLLKRNPGGGKMQQVLENYHKGRRLELTPSESAHILANSNLKMDGEISDRKH